MFTCEAVEKAAKPSDIEALAEKLEPALARAVRDLIKDHVASVNLADLEAALKAGETWKVMDIIGSVDPVKAAAVREGLQNAVWAGGALATSAPVLNEARFVFNRLNPALISWLEGYSLNLIRDIGEGTRAAVRTALVDGMTKGVNPIQQARQIKQAVGLTESQAKAVQNYRKALETVHTRRSLKSWGLGNERSKLSGVEVMPVDPKTGKPKDGINQWRLRDQRYDSAIRRAQESKKPLTPEQIDKMVDRYQERMIQNRARTIARSESLRATNVGIQEAWRQAIEERKVDGGLVRKRWVLSKDERTCFPAGVPVSTPDGKRPIEVLTVGDEVFTSRGVRTVTGTLKRKWKGSLTILCLVDGRALACTPDHRVWDGADWREAKDFAAGDAVYTLSDQPTQIARIVDLSLRDANNLPTARPEEVILARISLRVAMPELAVRLNGDTVEDQCEVEAVSSERILLDGIGSEQFEAFANLRFEAGFSIASPVACEGTEAGIVAWNDPKLGVACEARLDDRRSVASLGAILAVAPFAQTLLPGEALSTPLAVDVFGCGQAARARADLVPVHGRGWASEILGANGASLCGARHAREFTGFGAEFPPKRGRGVEAATAACALPFCADPAVKLVARAGAIDAPVLTPLSFDHFFAAASALVGEGQGLDLRALIRELVETKTLEVFDIEVEGAHEFSANNVRVHNCHICTGIYKAQPKRGIPLDASFANPNGLPLKGPIAHPNCRCTTFVKLLEPEQLLEEAA